ncbi:MAG TPA: hypothetical protein VK203_14700 [Nostocaceae cyanobacterium]|nr:hypothetical protein [Nostocaceae cyanobacterium]
MPEKQIPTIIFPLNEDEAEILIEKYYQSSELQPQSMNVEPSSMNVEPSSMNVEP